MPFCTVEFTQHALKGQKLLAQGNALGINDIQLTPCKGKSFTYRRGFSIFIRCILKLLPLQGASLNAFIPRALPWARSFCPFRACCCGLLDHQGVLLIWAAWTSGRCCYGLLGVLLIWAFGPSGRCCPMQISQNFRAVWLKLPSMPFCTVEITQHALLYG